VKRGLESEQEQQLASDLDRALSLSQLSSLAAPRKFAFASKSDRPKGKSAEGRAAERGIHSSFAAKAGKHKADAKASSALESARKVKGQKNNAVFSPMRSELSSCSNSEYLNTR